MCESARQHDRHLLQGLPVKAVLRVLDSDRNYKLELLLKAPWQRNVFIIEAGLKAM